MVLAEPAIDRLAGHAEQMRGFALGQPFPHDLDRSPTNGFLIVGAQSSGILDFHIDSVYHIGRWAVAILGYGLITHAVTSAALQI